MKIIVSTGSLWNGEVLLHAMEILSTALYVLTTLIEVVNTLFTTIVPYEILSCPKYETKFQNATQYFLFLDLSYAHNFNLFIMKRQHFLFISRGTMCTNRVGVTVTQTKLRVCAHAHPCEYVCVCVVNYSRPEL